MPDAKAYIKKRERKNLLDEQLGSPSTRSNNAALQFENQDKYSRLKELTRDVNRNSNSFGSNQRPNNQSFSGFDDPADGLNSMTNYTAMIDITGNEDSFVDEANNTLPYTKQKRGYGKGDIRIGTSLSLSQNIYTLSFIAELRNEQIDSVTLEDGGRPPTSEAELTTPRGTVIGIAENFDENDPSFLENEAAMLEWEKTTVKRYEGWKQERTRMQVHVFVCMFSQIFLIAMLFKECFDSVNTKQVVMLNIDLTLLTAKGICAMILHLDMQGNVS